MIRSICVWLVRFCVRHVTSWPWPNLLSGGACAGIVLGLQYQYLSQLGGTRPVTAAAAMVIGAAWALAWWVRRDTDLSPSSPAASLKRFLMPGILVGLTLISPPCWTLHDRLIPEFVVLSRWGVAGYSAVWCALTTGLAVWCAARMALIKRESNVPGQSARRPSAAFVLGFSVGLAVAIAVTWSSLYVTALLGCVLLAGSDVWRMFAARRSPATPTALKSPSILATEVAGPAPATPVVVSLLILTAACGGQIHWVIQVLEFLLPATIFTLTSAASGLILGISYGCLPINRTVAARPGRSVLAQCLATVSLLTLSICFSMLVFRLVTLTGAISQVWLLHGVRWVLACCASAPLGYLWGLTTSRLDGMCERFTLGRIWSVWGGSLVLAVLGGIITETVLMPVCGLRLTCFVWLWVMTSARFLEIFWTREVPRNSVLRGVALGCTCLVAVAPAIGEGVRPELAARVLFSTNVFLADQAGIPRSELPFLDEGRLEFQTPSEHGAFTVWKAAVARHQLRENGIPRGTISTDSAVSPQDTGEVLLTLLPLTLHEEPRRVAILGLGSSVPLMTSLASPVLEVTSVESDPQLVPLMQRVTRNSLAGDLWTDERLTVTTADPALWVAGSTGQFDVVISNPDQSALVQSAGTYTREFYERAARRLSENGIFCQRLQYIDYGPRPLQTMAATLRSVFKHVIAVEIGLGEMAWVATNSDSGLVRSNIVDRMQSPHVRELMSAVGCDWSVMLTLAAYDAECFDKIQGKHRPAVNTAANGWFGTQLPSELMRWGAKSEEVQSQVTAHARKILNWVGEPGTDEDLLRRLAEVRGQRELVANYPDQYWGYRSQVRKQISTRPIPKIKQAKHEADPSAGLHPDDKHRLKYFQQLSKAIHGRQAADVELLASFAVPYDPLISLFMHQEVAEIAAQVPELPPSFELNHRLYMVYFSPSADRSVRNAMSALRLALDKPQCVGTDADRWDVINALLQTLQMRWQNRGDVAASNARLAARDVEENIVLVERALDELPRLISDIGYSAEDWTARKRSLERNLLRPLREYRERLQPLAAKQRYEASEQTQPDGTLPSEEDLSFPGSQPLAN